MKDIEKWHPVKGYEGFYKVSNLGNVKSLTRKVKCRPSNNGVSYRTLKGGVIKGIIGSAGYYIVSLNRFGIKETKKIHVLVSEAFLNHTPCGHRIVVDHIDNNRLNNNSDNLQLISNRKNISKSSKKKYVGVYEYKRKNDMKYTSKITINGSEIYLGVFDTKIEASKAYLSELKKLNE